MLGTTTVTDTPTFLTSTTTGSSLALGLGETTT